MANIPGKVSSQSLGQSWYNAEAVDRLTAVSALPDNALERVGDGLFVGRVYTPAVSAETPVISAHPDGAVYSQNTAATALFVTAATSDGGVLSYQWYQNSVDSTDGGTPIGSNSLSYTPPTDTVGVRYYYVIVTNTISDNGDGGRKTASATSGTAAVEINSKTNAAVPNIAAHPANNAYLINTSAAALTVSVSVSDGGVLSYQWYSNASNSNSGGTAVGTNSSSYTPSTAVAGTLYYYVVITNTINDNGDGGQKTAEAVSNAANITITLPIAAQTPNIISHPASGSHEQNSSASLTVQASVSDGGTLSYQWYQNSAPNNYGGSPLGSNSNTLAINTSVYGASYYYVVITNTLSDNGDGGQKVATATSNVASVVIEDLVVIFGSRWNMGNSSTVLTRLNDSVGKTFTPATSGTGGSSGFDGQPVYRDIRRCNLWNGSVTAYEGEPGFSLTPSNGDVMVEIKKFYYKITNNTTSNIRDFLISNNKADNTWAVAPAFDRSHEGLPEREYIYVGAYTCNDSYRSISGNASAVSMTRATARTGCQNRGTGYYLWDFKTWWTINLLYLVEVANWNSQTAVGVGNVGTSAQINTGATNSIAFHSGSTVAAGVQTGTVKYRHMENLWGNIFQFIDGINVNEYRAYIANRPSYHADDTTTNYTALSYLNFSTTGQYQTALGFDSSRPWAQICTAGNGTDSTYIPDGYYCSTGWRVVRVGGYWNGALHAGLFFFYAINGSAGASANLGCRLLFLP